MATARCLAIPEVINLIFPYSTLATCANCIRVCRFWKEIAKDHVWENIDDVFALFSVLAPLRDKFPDGLQDLQIVECIILYLILDAE